MPQAEMNHTSGLPDLVSARYVGSLALAQMCECCRVNSAVCHLHKGLNPDGLAPLFS